jgi:predicted dehydrogenase
VIGCGGKGGDNLVHFSGLPGVRIVGVSDPDLTHMDGVTKSLEGALAKRGQKLDASFKKHQDFRRFLEDPNVDVVVIAAPNHWHTLMTIMACQAGKDVYVEKPVSHCIWEGRKAVEAARKYNRIVQSGTQQRSDPALIEAAADIKKGTLGKVHWIHGLWYRYRQPIGKVTGPTPVPETVDYDLWCGPGPKPALMRKNLHYDWHWFWAYGNGEMGNIAPHNADDMRHLLDMTDVPTRVLSIGGRFAWDDDGETPNTHFCLFDYRVPLVLEIRDLPHDRDNKSKRGESVYRRFGKSVKFTNIVKCENGFYNVTRGGGFSFDNQGNRIRQFKGDGGEGHAANFLKAVRSRKYTDLNADILLGHLSAIMIHQANIAHRVGQAASVEETHDRVKNFEEALETLKQMVEHLHANEVDLTKQEPILSPWLTYDVEKEVFVGDHADQANQFVKDSYRAPFIVPDKV